MGSILIPVKTAFFNLQNARKAPKLKKAPVLQAISNVFSKQSKLRFFSNRKRSSKGRTIRKLMGGGPGEVQKKLSEKKFMHAN